MAPSPVRFRRAIDADFSRLCALLREGFPVAAWPGDVAPWDENHVRDLLREARVYVAEDEQGHLVATATLDLRSHVRHVAVASAARGQGVGAAMMRHVEEEAARAGARQMSLAANADDPALTRFYEGLGYRSVGVIHVPQGGRYHQFRKNLPRKVPPGVRLAREEDAEALSAFFERCYQENEKLGLQYYAPAVAPEVVRHLLRSSEVYVREEGRRIVAAVALTPLVEVRRLSVDPTERDGGHASDLMSFALERAEAMGAAEARLEIDAEHPFLAGFYERRGFVELGTMVYDPGTEEEFRSRWFGKGLLLSRPAEGGGSSQ